MSRTDAEIRLLMVDDEAEFLQAMAPGLARRGFRTAAAENGVRALQLLAEETWDAVVLDVKMPGIDGIEVFRRIHAVRPELPVIMLTGHGNIQHAFETSRQGAYEYLTKPCDVETLARVVREAVERSASPRSTGGEPAATPGHLRVLLVDDEVELVRSLSPALERRGFEVDAVHDGPAALEAARERRYDVAVVDVVLPGMDGLALMNALHEEAPLLEVVILTGNPRVGDVRRGLHHGAFDYLVKPCPVDELARVIRAAGDRRWHREEAARTAAAHETMAKRPD